VGKALVEKPRSSTLLPRGVEKEAPSERSSLGVRRRNRKSHEAILAAALKLVKVRGYAAVTIEAIASEAGVGKQTIYRWWSSKASVVFEALSKTIKADAPLPNTGSLERDLEEFLLKMFVGLVKTGAGRVIASLFSEAQANCEFDSAFRSEYLGPRRDALRQILEKGKDRKELGPDVDLDLAIDSFYGSMWYRMLNPYAPLDRKFARKLVRQLLKGFGTV
jgi:AcrR family transcriptional regulator